jgi:RNA polymerase sigma-70 factor (ECF subfamily)
VKAPVDRRAGRFRAGSDRELRHGSRAEADETTLLVRLRDGDEDAFNQIVDRYYPLTLHVARSYVRTPSVAEEVAQEAWMGVIEGLHRFEGRSSLKNWIVRITVNKARTRGVREARSVPFSALVSEDGEGIDPNRFRAAADPFPGHWTTYPQTWRVLPDEAIGMNETLSVVQSAIDALPEMQRLVVTLRDIEGWGSAEVATALGLTDANERVLLHRARTKVRAVLERHLADE